MGRSGGGARYFRLGSSTKDDIPVDAREEGEAVDVYVVQWLLEALHKAVCRLGGTLLRRVDGPELLGQPHRGSLRDGGGEELGRLAGGAAGCCWRHHRSGHR